MLMISTKELGDLFRSLKYCLVKIQANKTPVFNFFGEWVANAQVWQWNGPYILTENESQVS